MKRSVLLVVCLNAVAMGQSFEVASIKLHLPPIRISADPRVKGNRVTGIASTLEDMITVAYHVRYDQIAGGPGWASSDHYDLEAKAEGDAPITDAQMRPMLQNLLAERFQLKIHRESKEVPMYSLVVAKNGPKFHESAPDEAPKGSIMANSSGMHMEAAKETMESLALMITGNGAERPVMDKTGLTGKYTFKLEWTRGMPGVESSSPALTVALEDQLGLKLVPTKGMSQIIVIDHAEKPTAN